MKPVFIIEHLEPEVFPWCRIEYLHISKTIGKENLWFCNLKGKKGAASLTRHGRCIQESVVSLHLQNACVLEPEAPQLLTLQKAQQFQYFIFGGILGDHPPKKRTQEELSKFLPHLPKYNLGKKQMSTDNAVLVVSEIAQQGRKLSSLRFQDGIEIKIDNVSSVQLPYRYRLVNNEPFISPALVVYLKKKKGI
jgi:ribosome biogenesis SPOUT family RNA methylase Rps3